VVSDLIDRLRGVFVFEPKHFWQPLLLGYLFIISCPLSATGASPKFCKSLYGDKASLTFEPVESNQGVIVEDGILKTEIKPKKDAPAPTGFRCSIQAAPNGKKSCPKEMTYDEKRSGMPTCLSQEYDLVKLCPKEIESYRAYLKTNPCNTK
jgi:hypothetical protein